MEQVAPTWLETFPHPPPLSSLDNHVNNAPIKVGCQSTTHTHLTVLHEVYREIPTLPASHLWISNFRNKYVHHCLSYEYFNLRTVFTVIFSVSTNLHGMDQMLHNVVLMETYRNWQDINIPVLHCSSRSNCSELKGISLHTKLQYCARTSQFCCHNGGAPQQVIFFLQT